MNPQTRYISNTIKSAFFKKFFVSFSLSSPWDLNLQCIFQQGKTQSYGLPKPARRGRPLAHGRRVSVSLTTSGAVKINVRLLARDTEQQVTATEWEFLRHLLFAALN